MSTTEHLKFLQRLLRIQDKKIALILEPYSDDKQARFEALEAEYAEIEYELYLAKYNPFESEMMLEHDGKVYYFLDAEEFKEALTLECIGFEYLEDYLIDVSDAYRSVSHPSTLP